MDTLYLFMGKRKWYTIVIDWDGTLVENKWPDMGDWMPGAIEAVTKIHAAGHKIVVHSCRLSPFDPFTFQKRDAAHVASEVQRVRAKLDNAGLTFVDIWTTPGKPGGYVYIDDKAERYHGKTRSWKTLTEKVLARCGDEVPDLPVFDQEVARGESLAG